MQHKFIPQLLEQLRAESVSPAKRLELILQVLAWFKLSKDNALSDKLRFNPAMLDAPALAIEAMKNLADLQDEPLWSQAFSGIAKVSTIKPLRLGDILQIIVKADEAGFLEVVDFSDAATLQDVLHGEGQLLPELAAFLTALSLAQVEGKRSAYVAWDHGAQLATRLAKAGARVFLEVPMHSPIPALVSILTDSPVKISYSDPITTPTAVEGGSLISHDLAVAFPPLGMRVDLKTAESDWFGRFPEKSVSMAVLAVRHLIAQAQARVVVAVPSNVLFSSGAEKALRQDLLQKGMVQVVVAMPPGLLLNTNAPFAILVLAPKGGHDTVKFVDLDQPEYIAPTSKTKVKLVNAEELAYAVMEDGRIKNAAIVSVSDILTNDAQLQVSRYVLPESAKKVQAWLASSKTVPLRDLVKTVRPPLGKATTEEDARHKIFEIGAADLPDYGYIRTPGRAITLDEPDLLKIQDQFLRPHDFVLIIKGSVGKIGIVPADVPPPGPNGWIAGQSAIVLRSPEKASLDPRALFMLLRSPMGQALIGTITSGATIPILQLKELMKLPIPVPTLLEAQPAIQALEKEDQLQRDIENLKARQAETSATLWPLD